jgi:acyl-CoA synthetase
VSAEFDRPRPVPESVAAEWVSAGLWSVATVSDVLTGDVDPDGVACVVDDQRHTFGALRSWSIALAATLREAGVAPGDRAVIQLRNSVELLVSLLGCWRLGVIAVPVLPLFREHELTSVMRQTAPAAVIAAHTAEMDAALDAAGVAPRVRYRTAPAAGTWRGFPRDIADSDADTAALPGFAASDACTLVLFTSGTTAEPKGVRHDSRSLLAEVNSYLRSAALCGDDVIFNPAPIAHVGALVVSVLVPFRVGCPVVLQSRWDPVAAAGLISREKVTFAVGAPVFLNELVQQYESADYRGHRLATFQTGAAPAATALLTRAASAGIVAWRAWGMTEAPTISYGCVDDPLDRRAGTDGKVEPGSQLVAVDTQGRHLPAGSEGELVLRSPKQMMGYVDGALDAVDADGWLATGDLGCVGADGWVRITGRIKDIVNRGGEKFACREIEDALSAHSAIAAAAVLGVPEPRLGEQVIAYVTIRPGRDYPGFEALTAHLRSLRIAPQKHPVAIDVLDELPMTPTGKVLKAALARRWQAGS